MGAGIDLPLCFFHLLLPLSLAGVLLTPCSSADGSSQSPLPFSLTHLICFFHLPFLSLISAFLLRVYRFSTFKILFLPLFFLTCLLLVSSLLDLCISFTWFILPVMAYHSFTQYAPVCVCVKKLLFQNRIKWSVVDCLKLKKNKWRGAQ